MFRGRLLPAAAALASAFMAIQGQAASTTNTISVAANVAATATITTSSDVTFGALTASGMTGISGALTITATAGDSLTIAVGGGQNSTGSQRRMVSNGHYMNYNIYQPNATGTAQASPAVPWGDGSAFGSVYSAAGTGSAQTFNVYAEVPSGQTLYSGTYNDMLTLTLSY